MGILEMDFERIFEAPLFLSNSHSITQCQGNNPDTVRVIAKSFEVTEETQPLDFHAGFLLMKEKVGIFQVQLNFKTYFC